MSFNRRANRYLYNLFSKGQKSGPDIQFQKFSNNNITIRSSQIIEAIPTVHPSKTLFEARQKTKRLYKRFCRLCPFMLKLWDLQNKITPEIANRNFANRIKFLDNIVDKEIVDLYLNKFYVQLHETEHLHGEAYHLRNLIYPYHFRDEDDGRDFGEDMGKKKGKFLKDFYKVKSVIF